MKVRVTTRWAVVLLVLCAASCSRGPLRSPPVGSATKHTATITLLPDLETGIEQVDGGAFLWIRNAPEGDVTLKFDLTSLPPGLMQTDLERCTLRLVAKDVTYNPGPDEEYGGEPVIVSGWLADGDYPEDTKILSLNTLSSGGNSVGMSKKDDQALRDSVWEAYNRGPEERSLSVRLATKSRKASSLFYSATAGKDTEYWQPSSMPRLVVQYTLPKEGLLETLSWPQHQQNPEHTGSSLWAPFRTPVKFTCQSISLAEIGGPNGGTIQDYPLVYRGNVYLMVDVSGHAWILALDAKGKKLWERDTGEGTVQRSPAISRDGVLYVVTEKSITGWDLNDRGSKRYSYGRGDAKLGASTDLTVGNDGSVFVVLQEEGVNRIYGFTRDLRPFLRSPSFRVVTSVTVSPDGQQIFAQARPVDEEEDSVVAIDITNPTDEGILKADLEAGSPTRRYLPLAGPNGWVTFAINGGDDGGRVWVWKLGQQPESGDERAGSVSQPVLGLEPDGDGVAYYMQDGYLKRDEGPGKTVRRVVDRQKGAVTSNLVVDGANNVFFWSTGALKMLACERHYSVSSELQGPQENLRLTLGPDGTLYANNRNTLFALKPVFKPVFKRVYASPDLALTKQDKLKTQTVYRANGRLTVGGVSVKPGTHVLFQAEQGISFAPGFSVSKGASLLCRTGF